MIMNTGSRDAQIGKKLMKKIPRSAKRIFGDGAYDGTEFRQEVEKKGMRKVDKFCMNALQGIYTTRPLDCHLG